MNGTKPSYKSKTVWGGAASIIAGLAMWAGVDIDEAALTESLIQLAAIVGGLVAIYGRKKADTKIG